MGQTARPIKNGREVAIGQGIESCGMALCIMDGRKVVLIESLKITDLLEVDIRELFVREYKQVLLSQES